MCSAIVVLARFLTDVNQPQITSESVTMDPLTKYQKHDTITL
ncbi:hypothetical protein Syn19_079 [Synechococcus phage Syn19]|uniref:Uncharacterized protein n=1 Tax=Synechococcus phage Syn19 TaxID=445684 RepID=E3SQ44_9CAUD|nr:hypothetical protein Syn19_079 [Synechococcus phage Syn19]ADO99478.1 hypothetical protein Syn19_079 [Synechococcus phage Syn19]